MSWILESRVVYKDGTEITGYFVRLGLGIFCELGKKEDAKRFRTKREAMDMARSMGRGKNMKAIRVD